MRARATAAVQSKIKTVAPPVREISPSRLPARTPVKFPARTSQVRGRARIDDAEAADPRLGGLAVAVEIEEDELEFDADLEDGLSQNALEAEASLAEFEALVTKQPYSAHSLNQDEIARADGSGDPRAMRDQVVVDHLPLVRAIAIRVHENLPVHVELDDLVHAGIMGLFDASGKYNPDKKVAFSSYAKHRIKGAILDSLRQLDWASRDLRRRHKQVEQVTRDLASTLHRNPTEAEIAAKMGVEVDRWRQMMLDLRNVGLVSASTRGSEHEDLPAPDFPSKPETQPDSMCAREQLRDMLAIAMKVLPERYQRVVLLYYTMKEIGTQLGINESRVSQIHKSALEKMAAALQQAGIHSSQAF
jgi:RNA polymerase sigma factor for flagellar operon FliA